MGSRAFPTLYPAVDCWVEWLIETLAPIDESVFKHYVGVRHLLRLVDRAGSSRAAWFAAQHAIHDYNVENNTNITFKEVQQRDPTYIMSEVGEWVAFVDSPETTQRIVSSDLLDPMDALARVDSDHRWAVVWFPTEGNLLVLRSPYTDFTEMNDLGLCDPSRRGDQKAFVLPPEIEAAALRRV